MYWTRSRYFLVRKSYSAICSKQVLLWLAVVAMSEIKSTRMFRISRVHPSTLSTCPRRPHSMPRWYHVPLRCVVADLVQLEVRHIAFRNLVCIHFHYLAGLDITAVCEFLKLADSFLEVVNHDLLHTLELSLLLPPSFPHPLLKSNLCRIEESADTECRYTLLKMRILAFYIQTL